MRERTARWGRAKSAVCEATEADRAARPVPGGAAAGAHMGRRALLAKLLYGGGEEADGSGSAGKVGSAERHRAHTHLPPSRACLDVPPALNSSTSALWPHCPSPGSRTRCTAGTTPINRERCKSIREEVRTSRSSPLARVPRRGEASGRRRGALQRPTPLAPLPQARGAATRFTAGTAPINRETCKSIREEVRTSRSSPLARVPRGGEPAVDVAARSSALPP